MASAQQIAERFLGAARKYPDARGDIFRKAAYTFMGLAQDPKNTHAAQKLARMGLDFAAAATRERPPTTDDFTDMLRETQIAYEEVGDREPLAMLARARQVHDERTPIEPGSMSIAPATFNKDATLGRSAQIVSFVNFPTAASSPEAQAAAKAAAIANGITDTQTVAFWQGVKKEAQAMTIDASLVLVPNLFNSGGEVFNLNNNRAYGLVEFGSDGNRTTVKFDLGNGKRFTVVGNYISVSIGMDPPRPGDSSIPTTYGASIGAFAAPSLAPLILSAYVDNLSNLHTPVLPSGFANEIIIPIPLKAAFLLPLQSDCALGDTARLDFLDIGGDIMYTVFYKQSDTYQIQTIPLSGDVSFVKVTNATGNSGVRNFRLPFQLSL